MPAALTSTSYAILGLLAIKPWTTYELAKQMDRSMRYFWPRAESKLYDEPPKLVAHGLARATRDAVGKRPRTVYAITPKGRRALRAWLDEPGRPPALEFEGLLKLFFGEHGDRASMLAHLAAAREWSQQRLEHDAAMARSYLDGTGPFPDRAAVIVLTGRFLTELATLVDDWATWAEEQVRAWPDDVTAAAADVATLRDVSERGPR